jgi:hypothetical protein
MSNHRIFISVLVACLLAACNLTSRTDRPTSITNTEPTSAPVSSPALSPIADVPTSLPLVATTGASGGQRYTGIGLPQTGMTVIVYAGSDRLDVHSEPRDGAPVVGSLSSFEQVEVIDGPQGGTKTWWKIHFAGIEGWAAGIGEMPFQTLIPVDDFRFCEAAPLVTGGQAEVFTLDGELSLFSEPTTTSRLITNMPFGAQVMVLSGPESVGANLWWRVQYAAGQLWEGYAVGRSGDFCTLLPV